jgi:acetyl esterase/lipase
MKAVLAAMVFTSSAAAAPVPWSDVAAKAANVPAGERIAYGEAPQQFGELRLPSSDRTKPYPVVVVIHGGCWRSEYDLGHIRPVADALTADGFATWTIEYRRLGDAGGGWPGTLEDVGRAVDALRDLAESKPLDLGRLTTLGHSAGGHLALWAAARRNLPAGGPLAASNPLPVHRVVGLAAISDLARYAEGSGNCNAAARELTAADPERLRASSPIELLPLRLPVHLVHGVGDSIVFLEQSERFAAAARAKGDTVEVHAVPGAGHFDVIAPWSGAWAKVREALAR